MSALSELVSVILTDIGIGVAGRYSKKGSAGKRSKIRIFIFLVCLLLIILFLVYIFWYGGKI